ncbi:hypothetical protein GQ44DRAFT_775247 [Phaeosphaeriaceae sp. PMI808]|nr:hypothetical protein GQ44DRAFT_775247 [Phaeosphaeriaceae sp. PMI808]
MAKTSNILALSAIFAVALSAAIPKLDGDADAAVVYPASIDLSWVDSQQNSKRLDSDEAVVYPAKVDLSWVDSKDRA